MANKRFWLGMLAIALTLGLTVAGCGGSGGDSGDDPDNDPNNPNSDNYKSEWLWSGYKQYTVTDGVASPDHEYKVTYTSYTDDKHCAFNYSYTRQINDTTTTYTFNYSINGNTTQYTDRDQTNSDVNTRNSTIVYDAESGLVKSTTYQSTTTSNGGTVNNYNSSGNYTIELLGTEGNVKTYKQTLTESKYNGESMSGTGSYAVYKIQNGKTLEMRDYTADGTLNSTTTYTYTYPDDPIIKKKLPAFYEESQAITYSNGNSSVPSTPAIEVVSDSDKELRIRIKHSLNGVLKGQYEQTYEPRKR
jgi:hypothetical protein